MKSQVNYVILFRRVLTEVKGSRTTSDGSRKTGGRGGTKGSHRSCAEGRGSGYTGSKVERGSGSGCRSYRSTRKRRSERGSRCGSRGDSENRSRNRDGGSDGPEQRRRRRPAKHRGRGNAGSGAGDGGFRCEIKRSDRGLGSDGGSEHGGRGRRGCGTKY